MSNMDFTLITLTGGSQVTITFQDVAAIGYAGRNIEKTMQHIRELEKLGVAAPRRIPTIFLLGRHLLTQDKNMTVIGHESSGEIEYVIAVQGGRVFIGLGSDHTDRKLEAQDVAKAKQVCGKPVSPVLWDYGELADHWDSIELRSWQSVDGRETLYQCGSVADILPVHTILKELEDRAGIRDNCVVFSGTVPLVDGYLYGASFRGEMYDPVLNRRISIEYDIAVPDEDI